MAMQTSLLRLAVGIARMVVVLVLCLGMLLIHNAVQAQVEGSGWIERHYKMLLEPELHEHIHAISPMPKSYKDKSGSVSYSNTDGVQTFKLSNGRVSNRIEIRVVNDYTSGSQQFQGDLKIVAPVNGETVFQIYGSSKGRATVMMLRGYARQKGSLTMYVSQTVESGIYGRWVKVNVVHKKGEYVRVYLDGKLKVSWPDHGVGSKSLFKFGCYGTLKTGSAEVQWRNVKFFSKH